MANDVEVRFGAQIEGLVAGINDAKSQLESLTDPIAGIVSAFQGLGEAAGVAFAVDKIVEFSEHYAELGEQIERTSLILGISTDQVQQLGFAIRMGGGDAETATLTIGILEKNIAEAASGSGTAATAFENMGIAVKNADGNTRSAVDILKDMADVMSKVSDANIRAEYGRALLGRGYQNLLPVLLEGREGFDKLNAILDQTNSKISNDQVRALDESAKKTKELSASWDGLVIELGADTAWTHVKQDAIDLTQSMTSLAKAIGGATHDLGEFLGLAGSSAQPTALNEFTAAAAKFRLAMANQNGAGGEPFGPNLPPGLTLPSLGKDQAGGKDQKDTLALDDIKTDEEIAKLKLQMQKDGLDQEVALGKESKAQELTQLQDLLGQEYDAEDAALEQKKGLYAQATVEYEQALNQQEVLYQKFLADSAKIGQQIAQANAEQVKKTQAEYKSFFDTIDKDLDQMLAGVLQGTQTWQQAMARTFSNLSLSFIEDISKMLVKAAALQALNLTGNGGGLLGQAVGKEVPQALGGSQNNSSNPLTAAMTALVTAITGSTAATTLNGTITQSAAAISQGGQGLTTLLNTATGANTTATLANTIAEQTQGAGGGAGGILSGLLGGGEGEGGLGAIGTAVGVASLDVGAWSIPQNGLAFLHAGEMVIPANAAQSFRAGAANVGSASTAGGAPVTINIQAIDTQTGAQFLKKQRLHHSFGDRRTV